MGLFKGSFEKRMAKLEERRANGDIDGLVFALLDEDARIRSNAVVALEHIGEPAVAPLVRFVGPQGVGGSPAVTCAVTALRSIGAPTIPGLVAGLHADHPNVRLGAAWIAGELRDPQMLEPLAAALGDESFEVRKAVAGALGAIGDKRAVEPLLAASQDSVPAVRLAAQAALAMLEWTSVPEILGRWAPAPPGICDLCSVPLGPDGSRVPAPEFKQVVEKGYNPFARGRAGRAEAIREAMGVASADDAYAAWRVLAAKQTTDWALCPTCAQDVATFMCGDR